MTAVCQAGCDLKELDLKIHAVHKISLSYTQSF